MKYYLSFSLFFVCCIDEWAQNLVLILLLQPSRGFARLVGLHCENDWFRLPSLSVKCVIDVMGLVQKPYLILKIEEYENDPFRD